MFAVAAAQTQTTASGHPDQPPATKAQSSAPIAGRRLLVNTPHSNEIHIDVHCRIHEVAPHSEGKKQHVFHDRGICDVGPERNSSRIETDLDDGKVSHVRVDVQERTFRLHNPTAEPAVFVLEQEVLRGWEVDSDPQPNEIAGQTAIFRIPAGPGETVDVHVGERSPARIPQPKS